MTTGKVIWLGNGVAEFLKASDDAEPIRVGEAITLTQGQVTALEATGHQFATPNSPEGKDAKKSADKVTDPDPAK